MSKVTETRVKITLTDAMSGPLRGIQGQLNSTNSAAASLSRSLKDYAAIGASMAAGAMGIAGVTDKISEMLSAGINFNKSMETNAIGMAGILTSMTTLNGETLKWNDALNISQGIIKNLNDDALKTAATSEELINTFRALLGPGLGAGMNIEQIQKLTTVGVNAVKSLGLNNTQLVQELRDLVQGGIQPASSTLATALGLKDSDIKAAKESAEGLYSFLMKRLQGFEQAAAATPKTLAGMQDQLQEGLTRSLAVGLEPVMNEYKEVLQGLNSMILSPERGINEQFVDDLKSASDHVVNMWEGFKNIADVVSPIVSPAVGAFGDTLVYAADNVEKIAIGITAWKVVDIATDLYKVKAATDDVYQSQTLLGQAVQKVGSYWNSSRNIGLQAVRAEIEAANNAAQVVVQAERRKQTALKNYQDVVAAANKTISSGNIELGLRILQTKQKYERLGVSAEQAGKLQYQAAKLAAKGQNELATAVLNAQEKHLLAAQAAANHTEKISQWSSKVNVAAGTVGSLSGAVMLLTDDTDSFAYSLANTGLAISSGILAINTLIEQLGNLATAYRDVAVAGSAAGLLKTAGLVGGGAVGIGLGVGATAAGIYALTNDLSIDDMWRRWTYSSEDWDKYANQKASEYAAGLEKIDRQRKQAEAIRAASEQADNLQQKFVKAPEEKKSSGKSAAERAAEKAKKEFEKNERAMNDLMAELDRKILEDTGSQFDINMAKLDEELQKMQSKIDKAKLAGVDTSGAAARLQEYESQEIIRIKRQEVLDKHQLEMDYIDARQEANLLSAQQADAQRLAELNSYKAQLQEMLSTQRLTLEQRLQLEQEYAATIQAIQQAQATNWQANWDSVLAHIRDTQFDQTATIKSGWDDITSTITNFGQNMLTEQKSFSERCKDLYNDLANSIMNTMMKVIMQGLVMKAILGAFGLGGTTPNVSDYYNDLASGIGGKNYLVPPFAKGGIASGWALVGEQGPELVNFTNPGRVYTAEQTAAALGGKGNPTNVKVVIENRSGEKIEATSANASFDGEGLIVGIVLDAIRTNKNGMQDAIKSLAGNY